MQVLGASSFQVDVGLIKKHYSSPIVSVTEESKQIFLQNSGLVS